MLVRSLLIALAPLVSLPGTAQSEPHVEIRRNIAYVERDTGPLALDLYMPQGNGPFPGVLVVHGGAWRVGSRGQLAAVAMKLAREGYTTAAISYRLAPQSKFPAQLFDCQAAVRWMRANAVDIKLDASRIGGFGYSAGGHLVALLGTLDDDDFREEGVPADSPSARLQVVVAGGAPCDFRTMPSDSSRLAYWLGGTPAEKPDLYRIASPASFISNDDPPMFFFHGKSDAIVPYHSPTRMVERLQAAGVTAQMYTIENLGHTLAMFDMRALERAFAFADKHLKASAHLADETPDDNPVRGASDGR